MSIPSSTEGRRDETTAKLSSLKTCRPPPEPNIWIQKVVSRSQLSSIDLGNDEAGDDVEHEQSRSELDTHANMVVVGKHSLILNQSGRTAEVAPFSPDCGSLESVPIVDAVVAYDCPYEMKTYILVLTNALYVPSMDHNLLPPFILREAGLEVNDVPKIQVKDPDVRDHSIWFPAAQFRIPLGLWGVFSYFPTRKPTWNELQETEENVLFLTPDGHTWDPHSDAYARNEESMLDWEGDMVQPKDRLRILVEDLPEEDAATTAASLISSLEAAKIDATISSVEPIGESPDYAGCIGAVREADTVHAVLGSIASSLDPLVFHEALLEAQNVAKFATSIGATTVTAGAEEEWQRESDGDFEMKMDEAADDDGPPSDDITDLHLEGDEELMDYFAAGSTTSSRPKKGVSAEYLSKIWRIDLKDAKRTLDATTQLLKRSENATLSRNYTTSDRMLRYRRINEHFFMDTFFSTKKAGKSARGYNMMQLFVTDKGYVHVVPMKSRKEIPQAMKAFAKEVGAPDAFICDAAPEQTSAEVRSFCHKIGSTLRVLEENTPWANRAELYIGLTKEAVRKDMKFSDCPLAFWCYCFERRARINNLTARDLFQLEGRNAHFSVTGEEGDISNLCQFNWYEWCYYRENTAKFPFNREILGRVLGPAKGEGNEMAQWVLKANGNVVPRRTVRPLNTEELNSETEKRKRTIFDQCIERRWGTSISGPPDEPTKKWEAYEDDDDSVHEMPEFDDPVDATGAPIDQQPLYDKLIHAEINLPQGDRVRRAKVIGRTVDSDGRTIGTYNDNPIINTLVYDVEFPDGEVKEYAANTIAENLFEQVDSEGFTLSVFDGIIDYAKDEDAIDKKDFYLVTKSGRRRQRKTTCGWKLLVQWKDGSEQWIPLKELKESHPIQTAEFAKARGIDDEPAFAWWVPFTLRKRDAIISLVKSRINKATHKYGIEIPRSLEHAYELDKKNGNDFWRQAIGKEMCNVGIAFEILEDKQPTPVGWSRQSGHLVFDVKMDFTRKARWVLDGHKTSKPDCSTYAGVVSRESVRIALTYAALNGIPVFAGDIQNAYLQSPSSQKHYIICGPEFGIENIGKRALIRRALYGGKSAGRDFRNHLRECMDHLGFRSCPADPDVWMRPAVKSDGSEIWEYCLLYVDDMLVVSERGEEVIREEIGKYFVVKPDSIGPPSLYLGGHVRLVTLENGVKAWAFSSSQYVQAAVKNVETYLKSRGSKLAATAKTPLPTSYRPEADLTPELNAADAAYYQSLIGVLRWMVELGRVDICLEVSMMSSHLALPREGHLSQLFHIFAHLKKHHNAEMVFDPSDPLIDESDFARRDWTTSEFGLKMKEEVPPNMPQARGLGFIIRAFVDADHAGDNVTRRSRTGFLIYLNSAPVYWMSKKQTSVETSSFGSEFIAMKQCTEYIRGLRYKLRMMGIPCEGPAYVYGDNQSVLANTTIPDSVLKKKSQSLAYHFVREGCARDEWRTAYVNTHHNVADLLTKLLPSGEKRWKFVRMVLHHICTVDRGSVD